MGDAIDREELAVYTQILHISPSQCPPNHYELLRVAPDERDGTKIEAAARQRMEELRKGVSPELMRAARFVLKRIERARTCLSDTQARAAYDLAQSLGNGNDSAASLWDDLDLESVEASSKSIATLNRDLPKPSPRPANLAIGKRLPTAQRKQPARQQKVAAYSIFGALLIVSVIAALIFWPRSEDAESPRDVPSSEMLAKASDPSRSASESEPSKSLDPTHFESSAARSETSVSSAGAQSVPEETAALTSFQSRDNVPSKEQIASKDLEQVPTPSDSTAITAEIPTASALTANALSELLDTVELPTQRPTDSALPSTATQADEGIELGPVPSQGLNLTIDPPTAMSVKGVSFDITSDPNRVAGTAWEVRLRSEHQQGEDDKKSALDDIAAGLDEVVARLYVEDGRLKFAWTNSRYSQIAEQLRNCVLCLSYSNQSRRIQLRSCQKIAPVVLDFEQNVVNIPVSGDTLPLPDTTFLAVQPSPALLNGFTMSPDSGIVSCNKVVTLKLADEQQQIEIRLMLRSSRDGFIVSIGPRYRLGSRWQPFTTERVNAGLKGLETALVRHKTGLNQAQNTANKAKSAIPGVQSRLSSNDPAERQNAKVQLRGLQIRLNGAERMIKRKQREIPETEQNILLMRRLVDTGNRLRGYTELGIRVLVKTGNGEFDLLRTE